MIYAKTVRVPFPFPGSGSSLSHADRKNVSPHNKKKQIRNFMGTGGIKNYSSGFLKVNDAGSIACRDKGVFLYFAFTFAASFSSLVLLSAK